jgi:hypothetical protein
MEPERCSWCGTALQADEGYRAAEPAGARRAAFCRLEHAVPWAINGAHWEPGGIATTPAEPELERCAHCDGPVGATAILLVHHRGEHRIADAFCSIDHLRAWASAGGRWR